MTSWVKKRQRKSGVRYTACYRDAQGRELTAGTWPTKAEAAAAAASAAVKVMRGTHRDPQRGRLTIAEWADIRLRQGAWGISETSSARSRINQHIKPALGHIRLTALTRDDVQKFVNDLQTKPVAPRSKKATAKDAPSRASLTPKTIKNIFTTLTSLMTDARVDGRIEQNPCEHIDLPTVVLRSKRAMTPEQFGKIMGCLAEADPWWVPMVQTDIDTGLRWGELMGLRVCDLQDDGITVIEVVNELTYAEIALAVKEGRLPKDEARGRFSAKDGTKTDNTRFVDVRPGLIALLREVAAERGLSGTDSLFQTKTGGIPSRATYRQDVWRKAVIAAGLGHLKDLRPHDLRGASASWHLSAGADPLYVLKRFGWKSLQTVAIYRGILPADADKSAALLDDLLGELPTRRPGSASNS